ncbi:DEAD/DEAH box helicase [Flavobacterium sp. HNIBRBA15423]|uniref:DEAD/DEAH box helicase n=1 Tax=Flavobacterium sp. HNIBRBA15423 TaxID=3458683 RepID=UPI0040442D63
MTKPSNLWAPQEKAISKIESYIADFQKGSTKASCLIKMPTGSGKTGVITCISHLNPNVKGVLVVAPRDVLRTQLYEEINSEFFSKIKYKPASPKGVVKLTSDKQFQKEHHEKIVVTTIQKLNSTYKRNPTLFKEVCEKFDLVIFDEGHYEPAKNWSETIRTILSPKIIFTATPFRNDLKKFNFSFEYVYSITQSEAEKLNILRTPEFIPIKFKSNPKDFVDKVLLEFTKNCAKHKDARLMIRCEDHKEILKIAKVLNDKKIKFVGIHERFNNPKQPWQHKKVPSKDTDATIWIHQFKLIEGFDDPRFRMLATYKPMRNSRQLIQQIGRILRNPEKETDNLAYVLDDETKSHQTIWNNYIKYDEQFKNSVGSTYGDSLLEVLKELPNIEYIDRTFRSNYLDSEIKYVEEEIALPLSCNIYEKSFWTSDLIKSEIKTYLDENDHRSTFFKVSNESGLFIHISYSNSSHLVDTYFFNVNLQISFYKVFDKYIAFYNTQGNGLNSILAPKEISPISTSKLKKLISNRSDSRLTSVSLKNSNLGNSSISSHSFSAGSIADIAPFLDDHGQVISSAIGYSLEQAIQGGSNPENYRRYLGFSNGRITQSNLKFVLKDYLLWLDHLIKILDSSTQSISVFSRYAKEIEVNEVIEPKHILLDFSEIKQIQYKIDETDLESFEVASEIVKNKNKFEFKVTLNNEEYDAEIVYDPKKKSFYIESESISESYWNEDKIDLVYLLNSKQSFRIITNKKNVFYAFGRFYNPNIKFGSKLFNKSEFQLRNVLVPVKELATIKNEKGSACSSDEKKWDINSMFNFIDEKCKRTIIEKEFDDLELLICDDMGEEVADFILCTKGKVAFIHVKGVGSKSASKVSASNLMDVCGQATKNIEYLSMFNSKKPSGVNSKWGNPWTARGVSGQVKDRLRYGTFSNPDDTWKHINLKISDPSIDKEVWLFLGGILSKKEFIKKLGQDSGNSVALQALVLLNGTLANVGALGCKLKVFCSE